MGITSRQRRPLDRTVEHERSTSIIVVATEGAKTEKNYFEIFKSKKVQIHVIPNKQDRSSPKYILQNLDDYAAEFQIRDDDQLWLAIDVDRWTMKELNDICQQCIQKEYNLAISNPCFELWLLYHFQEMGENYNSCHDVKDDLKPLLNKAVAGTQEALYLDSALDAVQRARDDDEDPDQRWPRPQGSHVYKIIEQVL